MADWPAKGGANTAVTVAHTTLTEPQTVTSGGSANTYGSWVELASAAPFDVDQMLVQLGRGSLSTSYALDLGIGASGSEVVIAEKLRVSVGATFGDSALFVLPLRVPAGERLAVRCMSSGSSKTSSMQLTLLAGEFGGRAGGMSRVETIGGSDSTGEEVACANGSKGSWVQMVAASAFRYRQLLVASTIPGTRSLTSSYRSAFDIGVGAAASEQVVFQDLFGSSYTVMAPPWYGPLPVDIPAGSRVAVRGQSLGPSQNFRLTLYGIG